MGARGRGREGGEGGMRDRCSFPFFARSIAGKLKSPLCNGGRRRRRRRRTTDETERFRYSSDIYIYIYQNSRHVANLDASASTTSISNNTREKNDIGRAVHRFFSPSFFRFHTLSFYLSLRPKFPFSKRWSNISLCPSTKHRVGSFEATSSTLFPCFIMLFCSVEIRETLPPPVEKGDSLYTRVRAYISNAN